MLERIGQYEILGELGRGATGVVYRARQPSLNREVALKVLAPSLASDPGYVERFHREAELASSLEHPLIVPVYDTGCADGWHYIAMRLVRGATLEAAVANRRPDVRAAVGVATLIAEALSYAHEHGVVHRDLKPSNVLTTPDGRIALVDFGIARATEAPGFTQTGAVFGTPDYMSPEQARGEPADARSDLYALGMVLYFMLAGRPAFSGGDTLSVLYRQVHEAPAPLRQLNPEVSPAVSEVVSICLAKDPAARFATAAAVRQALSAALEAPEATGAAVPAGGEMAALSLDIVRSMQLKQQGDERSLAEAFAAFRTLVNDRFREHGCLAQCWAGDGVLALFPESEAAIRAAAGIQRALPRFNRDRVGSGGKAIQARAAVDFGPVPWTAGQPLGEVTSQTLDAAGRLQKLVQPGEVAATWGAYTRLTSRDGFLPGPRTGALAGAYCWSEWNVQQNVQPAVAPQEAPLDSASAAQLRAALAMQALNTRRDEGGGRWTRLLGVVVAVWAVAILIYLVTTNALRPVKVGPRKADAEAVPAGPSPGHRPPDAPAARRCSSEAAPLDVAASRASRDCASGTWLAGPRAVVDLSADHRQRPGGATGAGKMAPRGPRRPAGDDVGGRRLRRLSDPVASGPHSAGRTTRLRLPVAGHENHRAVQPALRDAAESADLRQAGEAGVRHRGAGLAGGPIHGRGSASLEVKKTPSTRQVPLGTVSAYPFQLVEEFDPGPAGGKLKIEHSGFLAPGFGIVQEEVLISSEGSPPVLLERALISHN